jgi:predicted nucleic acid-binding Zn ribbon protein
MDERENGETDGAAQAKEAMERARKAARGQGSGARRKRFGRRPGVDPVPYGRGRDPVSIGDEIPEFTERMGWSERMEIASIGARWNEIVGEDIARHCTVESFDDGVLTLQASSTAWAEQLKVVSGTIRSRVNDELGRPVVSAIRVLRPSTRSWTKGPRSVKGRGPRDTYG